MSQQQASLFDFMERHRSPSALQRGESAGFIFWRTLDDPPCPGSQPRHDVHQALTDEHPFFRRTE